VNEPLDLDALESQLFWADGRPSVRAGDAMAALIAELRACRAERDEAFYHKCTNLLGCPSGMWKDRAERASAELFAVKAYAAELQDTIARVDALCEKWYRDGHILLTAAADEVGTALRGDQ
jgi:hypothetical protein